MNKSNTLGVVHNMSQRSCQRWVRPSYCSPEQEPHICMCYTELHLSNATRIFELTMFGMSFHNGSKQFPSDDYPGFVQQCTWWRIYLNRKHSLDILFCTLALWLVLTLECAEDLPARRAQSLGRHSRSYNHKSSKGSATCTECLINSYSLEGSDDPSDCKWRAEFTGRKCSMFSLSTQLCACLRASVLSIVDSSVTASCMNLIHKQMCVRLASLLNEYTLKNKKLLSVGNMPNDL